MTHMSPAFPSNKGLKTIDQWSEKYEKPSVHSHGHQAMTNTNPPSPQNDGLLNKPTHDGSDQNISLKSNSFNEKKCQVYVHHFNKVPSRSSNSNYIENNWRSGSEIHQNLYKHECSDFYDAKIRSLKKQFDNLSLQSKKPQTSSPYKIPKGYNKRPNHDHYNHLTKVPYAKSSLNAKINKSILFKPEHKAIIDKLEESYWAKWKPNKTPTNKESHPKMKGLYTENEKIKVHYQNNIKSGRKERGDSNKAIIPPEKDETSENNFIYVKNSEQNEIQQEKEVEVESSEENEDALSVKQVESAKEVVVVTDTSCVLAHDSDLECSASSLKHTDSFILTAKKQSQEKPHYQQPKCIKLFKNADYTTSTQTNYIKGGTRGGSYTLKSCLKKESSPKSNTLGRPGSPVKITTTRRPGKANRFTK